MNSEQVLIVSLKIPLDSLTVGFCLSVFKAHGMVCPCFPLVPTRQEEDRHTPAGLPGRMAVHRASRTIAQSFCSLRLGWFGVFKSTPEMFQLSILENLFVILRAEKGHYFYYGKSLPLHFCEGKITLLEWNIWVNTEPFSVSYYPTFLWPSFIPALFNCW